MAAVRPVAFVQGLLALVAMGCLITVFLRSDMSVLLVAENSHSAKPWLYKFAGAWGNHEGLDAAVGDDPGDRRRRGGIARTAACPRTR